MNIQDLMLTQDGFRLHPDEMQAMVDFVRSGGRFTEEALASHDPARKSLIAVSKFGDGCHFIRDGLHRSVAIYLGRDDPVLHEDEFVVESMTYDMYTGPAVDKGWYTPFDPRIEVRKADFHEFKQQVLDLKDQNGDVEKFISENKAMYCVLRTTKHLSIQNLAEEMESKLIAIK